MSVPSEIIRAVDPTGPVATPIDRYPGALVRFGGHPSTVEVLEVNLRATMLLAAPNEDLVGTGLADGLFEDDAIVLAAALDDPDDAGIEVVVRRGSVPPLQFLGITLARDGDGTVLASLCDRTDQYRLDDITRGQGHDLLRTQEELWAMANHDPLTGLPNRASCYDRLEQALARTRREARPTAVLFCDVVDFKPVNDQLGHAAGDALLVEIARRFNASVRETDTVCRFGGDEFVVICEGFDDLAGIEALARRLIDIASTPVRLGDASTAVGLCIGIAVARAGSTRDQLLAGADAAGARAKLTGRNTYTIDDDPA